MRYIVQFLVSFLFISPVFAELDASHAQQSYNKHGPHHISVLVADTYVSEEDNNFTIGLDYEYRLNKLLGLGLVVERAYGELEANTFLAVADIHFDNGFIMQVGPGAERRHHESTFVGRVGALYEFEMRQYTLSPQLHWDYHDDEANSIVAGVALGFAF